MKILIVLPYSGRKFGGGLSIFNAALAKALAEGHSVKVLMMQLPQSCAPTQEEHGKAQLLFIKNSESASMKNPGGAEGSNERNRLYALMESSQVLLAPEVLDSIGEHAKWTPDLIIGHSRFSGGAALLLKEKLSSKAKVAYFMHSIPVEGTVLQGYDAYEETIDASSAKRKMDHEMQLLPQADVVVAVGPFIRAGVEMLCQDYKCRRPPILECIGGADPSNTPVPVLTTVPEEFKLLFLGRASAPIKGLEDLLLAMLQLKTRKITLDVRYWDDISYTRLDAKTSQPYVHVVSCAEVQKWVDGMLGPESGRQVRVHVLEKTTNIADEIKAHHAVVMPSYMEHFGLVPFDSLAFGVPALVPEVSGSGMFLSDSSRVNTCGAEFVVRDFLASKQRPLLPADFLKDVPAHAFDGRPDAWSHAIAGLMDSIVARSIDAHVLLGDLAKYLWSDCANALTGIAQLSPADGTVFVQGKSGALVKKVW